MPYRFHGNYWSHKLRFREKSTHNVRWKETECRSRSTFRFIEYILNVFNKEFQRWFRRIECDKSRGTVVILATIRVELKLLELL